MTDPVSLPGVAVEDALKGKLPSLGEAAAADLRTNPSSLVSDFSNAWDKHFGDAASAALLPANRYLQQHVPRSAAHVINQAASLTPLGLNQIGGSGIIPESAQQVQQTTSTEGWLDAQVSNPLNWIPGGAAAKGAKVARAAVDSAAFLKDPGLSWAAITGALMNGGRLDGAVGRAVDAAIPGLHAMTQDAVRLNDAAKRIAQNPYHQELPPYLQRELDAANQELAARPKTNVVSEPNLKRDPKTNEISQQLTAAQQKQRNNFLNKFGVKDEAGFKNYVLMRGGLSTEESAYFAKHYKATLFTDPLHAEDIRPGEFIDPASHLDPLLKANPQAHGRAVSAIANFHALSEMADKGSFGSENPAEAILRGAVGFNHSLDIFERQFADTLRAVDPKLDGEHLAKILETGGSNSPEYAKLSPSGKFVHDLYRLYANMSHTYQRRAGLTTGYIQNYVPRIDHVLGVSKNRSGASSGPLIADYAKSRQWRLEATPKLTSVSTAEMAALSRRLGEKGAGLSEDHLAHLHQLLAALSEGDDQVLMQQLRKSDNVATQIEDWVKSTQDISPDSLKLRMVQAFQTIGDLNIHLTGRRQQLVRSLLSAPESAVKMTKAETGVDLNLKDPEVARIIAQKDTKAAESLALKLFTPKRTDLFDILGSGHFSKQFKAAHSAEVMKELEKTIVDLGDGAQGYAAVRKVGGRGDNIHTDRGYRAAQGAAMKYQDYLFAPQVAKFMERATRQSDLGLLEPLARLVQSAVKLIMYNPLFHGWNMAGRAMSFGGSHPVELVHWLKNDRVLSKMSPLEREAAIYSQRLEAWHNGVVTPHAARTVASDIGSHLSNTFGDVDQHALGITKEGSIRRTLKALPGAGKVEKIHSAYEGMQRVMWNQISDFGVAVFHIEREAQIRAGIDPENAARYAARRANSWMGHVSELDHNPNLHKLSRLVFFAPNYWRTLAELMMPVYKNSGIQFTPEMTGYIMRNQVATIASMFAMQKVTGNAANWVTSGHWQDSNQPGNQDRIEISRPELVRMLQSIGYPGMDKIDPNTGVDPSTGAHFYMDNPLARQPFALEQAAGLQSGYADWQPADALHGSQKVLAGRLSPLIDALGALRNIDVYNSLSTGTIRNINPDSDLGSGWNLAYAALAMTPLGLSTQSVSKEFQAKNQPMKSQQGPFGTTVPKVINDMLGGTKSMPLGITAALTGVNPPYETSQKTRGAQVGDDTYRKLNQINATYQTQTQGLAQEFFTGRSKDGQPFSPQQWQQQHQKLANDHRAQVEALMGGTPDYTHGTKGMVSQYEALYAQATDPSTGELDPDQLATLQSQFKSQHSQAEIDAMNAELNKNKQADPAYNLYQQALDGYASWRQQYAQDNGISVGRLKSESTQYAKLYGDPNAQADYLSAHPELQDYRAARQSDFYNTPQGLLYGLFYPNSVTRQSLISSRLSPLQAAQQQQALIRAGVTQ